MTTRAQALELFRREFSDEPDVVVRAPGRVNLIGEHTDYNDGFVLPLAIEQATWIAARRRDDSLAVVASEGYGRAEWRLPVSDRSTAGWEAYVRAMDWALEANEVPVAGWEGAIVSDVPIGAGLSSSASLHVAVGTAKRAFGASLTPLEVAFTARRAENDYLGVPTGIMDQLISAQAVEGHALLIDCRDLSTVPVPIPSGTRVVILDTSTRRDLAESRYADRRASCERAAAALGVSSLRDATLDDLDSALLAGARLDPALLDTGGADTGRLDTVDANRARHVIAENDRTLRAAEALQAGDVRTCGQLMNASHVSMRDLFEISSPALDAIVEAAQNAPGCLGARMTGGGFAGCAVALVEEQPLDDFSQTVSASYQTSAGLTATVYPASAATGASYEYLERR